jgi:hypothetical protein
MYSIDSEFFVPIEFLNTGATARGFTAVFAAEYSAQAGRRG